MKKSLESDYLKVAAAAVERQVLENPFLGIPADPDVAEYMGAFEDGALSLDDILDSENDSED